MTERKKTHWELYRKAMSIVFEENPRSKDDIPHIKEAIRSCEVMGKYKGKTPHATEKALKTLNRTLKELEGLEDGERTDE